MQQTDLAMRFDAADFEHHYERQPFLLGHSLHQHPLFRFESLASLAERLPLKHIEFNAADGPATPYQEYRPGRDYSGVEALECIAECCTWLELKHIEQIPEYNALLEELLDELRPQIERRTPGMYQRRASLFVSSPQSAVPYHIDPQHNFLLQIRGEKTFTAFDHADRELLPEAVLERFYRENRCKLELAPRFAARGERIALHPGDAMHLPINTPHFVENGDDVSISLSITYATPWARRREQVYAINGRLRSLGLAPTPFGVAAWRDGGKLAALHALRWLGGR